MLLEQSKAFWTSIKGGRCHQIESTRTQCTHYGILCLKGSGGLQCMSGGEEKSRDSLVLRFQARARTLRMRPKSWFRLLGSTEQVPCPKGEGFGI